MPILGTKKEGARSACSAPQCTEILKTRTVRSVLNLTFQMNSIRGEAERRPAYKALIENGMKPGVACDDGVAAYFVDESLVEFVSSRPRAMAYRLSLAEGKVVETPVKPRYLGAE
jgi:hypothetical protein